MLYSGTEPNQPYLNNVRLASRAGRPKQLPLQLDCGWALVPDHTDNITSIHMHFSDVRFSPVRADRSLH